jgi:hypothetical protein
MRWRGPLNFLRSTGVVAGSLLLSSSIATAQFEPAPGGPKDFRAAQVVSAPFRLSYSTVGSTEIKQFASLGPVLIQTMTDQRINKYYPSLFGRVTRHFDNFAITLNRSADPRGRLRSTVEMSVDVWSDWFSQNSSYVRNYLCPLFVQFVSNGQVLYTLHNIGWTPAGMPCKSSINKSAKHKIPDQIFGATTDIVVIARLDDFWVCP